VIGVAGRIAAGAHGIRNGNSDVIPNSVSGIIRDGDLKIHSRPSPYGNRAVVSLARARSSRPRRSPRRRRVEVPDSDYRYPGTGCAHTEPMKRILYCVLYNTPASGSHAHALA